MKLSLLNLIYITVRRFFSVWGKFLSVLALLFIVHSAYATDAGDVIQSAAGDFTDLKMAAIAAAGAFGIIVATVGCYNLFQSNKGHATKVGPGMALVMILAGGAMTVVTSIAAIAGSTATGGN